MDQAAAVGRPQRRGGRCGHPRRREHGRPQRAQRACDRLLLAREGERRRPSSRSAARQPTHRAAVGQAHRGRRRRHRASVRACPRQHRVRERARLREHVLRQHQQPVPEHLRARVPADGRPARRRQLLGPGPVRAGARARPPRRDAGSDHQPGRPVRDPERDARSDEGADDGLRLPQGRRHSDLDGLQGAAGQRQCDGADQRHLVEDQPAGRHVPGHERASDRLAECPLRPLPLAACGRERGQPRDDPLHDSGSPDPLDEWARGASRWAATRPCRSPISSSATC